MKQERTLGGDDGEDEAGADEAAGGTRATTKPTARIRGMRSEKKAARVSPVVRRGAAAGR